MTYFSLRKQEPEPAPDVEEPTEQEDQKEETGDQGSTQPTTLAAALRVGACGPGAWITARFGSSTAWGVHVGSVWAIFYYGGWTAAAIILAWLLAVGLFTPREHLDRLADRLEPPAQTAPAEPGTGPAEETPADPLTTLMWTLIGEAPGVHIKTLAERLSTASGQPVERATIRAELAARTIPVRASVRDAAGRVNEGVHRDDLTAWEQALPGPAPGPTPGPRSGPVATALTCDVGNAPTAVATPLTRLRKLLSRGAR